ncbi:putative fatty acid desaturase [Nocardioides flavus (ex Wang et al. 2016)]|uniref:Fatty acid desaturase n=1 Tax=Nocardioides flavus (ex Wang et al. 2016) TaxID=2058780 RepID=A0ABQ3HMR6_9ACTN|nr:acyl-CoA desaturase [Nocardioides flavus (ex Wang et al. 2016)]GHE17702.1 putative fatty acid desaturase [Nocardioides flavus (ex Wang et al. 2016)]
MALLVRHSHATPSAPTLSGRSYADLTDDEVEEIGRDLDALREQVLASRGADDAAYIRRVIAVRTGLEVAGRVALLGSRHRGLWWLGATSLAVAKVLDNMEIGHNVLHGQWDWMRDPRIHSSTWDWDHASAPEQWRRAHNDRHHVNTNVIGEDNDLGYGILRVDEAQEWQPRHLLQPVVNLVNACIFEWGVAMYDLDLGAALRERTGFSPRLRGELRTTARRAARFALRDYVLHPLLSGLTGSARTTLTANIAANVARNLWSHSVIMCGHFPEGVETFEVEEVAEDETRGRWYVRQMLGSADISGPPLLHVLCGNLSHQIEHHLFPDLPSNRYREVAGPVREVFERHGLAYNSRPLLQQVASAWHKVLRLSLPPRGRVRPATAPESWSRHSACG